MTRLFEGFAPYGGMEGMEVDVSVFSFYVMIADANQPNNLSLSHTHPDIINTNQPPYTQTTTQVWINAESSQDGRHTVGHTKAYIKVLVPRDEKLVGSQARVRVLGGLSLMYQGMCVSCIVLLSLAALSNKPHHKPAKTNRSASSPPRASTWWGKS
jgi:hypothetical protein